MNVMNVEKLLDNTELDHFVKVLIDDIATLKMNLLSNKDEIIEIKKSIKNKIEALSILGIEYQEDDYAAD